MSEQNPRKGQAARRFWEKVKKTLTHNWGWKIVSLVLAICLWGGLISQDTSLPRDKVIDGVRVTVANASTLRSNGLVVVSGLEENETVRIRVRVPQRYYAAVTAANYTARLDLAQITATGEQTLKITASSTNATMYGSVTEIFNGEITVMVEEYASQSRIPVEIRTTGEVPAGDYPAPLTYSPQYVDIGGPKEIVEAAVRCVAVYDQSSLSSTRNPNAVNLPFVFEDAEGNTLDGTNLTVTSSGQTSALQRIAVTQYVYPMTQAAVATDSLIKGEPAKGYTVTGVMVSPSHITLAGRETVLRPYLEDATPIFPYEQIDVTGRTRNVTTYLALRTPGNMEYVSTSVVQVTVSIEPVPLETKQEASGST